MRTTRLRNVSLEMGLSRMYCTREASGEHSFAQDFSALGLSSRVGEP
jgi:hypothetical protein